jgi:hypothetical protein
MIDASMRHVTLGEDCVLAATDGADVGVVGRADGNRASRAVLVLMVAARSAR